ncbi:MAG: MBG domain-containing protein [Bacteroidota bacterium]
MGKIFTKTFGFVAAIVLFVGIALPAHAQFVKKSFESNNEFYTAVTKDPVGNIYAIRSADGVHASVIKYAPNSTSFTTLFSGLAAGGGDESNGGFLAWGLAVNSLGDVYCTTNLSPGNTTTGTNVVNGSALTNHGNVIKLATNNGFNGTVYTASVFLNGGLFYTSLAFDAGNNLYVVQTDNSSLSHYTVRRYPSGSTSGTELFNDLNNDAADNYPHGIAIASNGDIYICDAGQLTTGGTSGHKGGVRHYVNSSGSYSSHTNVSINTYAKAVALDASGNLYVSETDGTAYANYRLNKYNASSHALTAGNITTPLVASGGILPDGITAVSDRNIFVAAGGNPSEFFELIGPATTPASGINFTATGATTATISWTNGDGDARAVFVALANSGTPSPANSTNYTANASFTSGSQAGAGWYCVYNGTGTSVNVTGLTSGNTYRTMVVEYNGSTTLTDENYLTTSNTGNTANVTTQSPTTINSVNRVTSTPSNLATVSFTAVFGSAVTGVTASNFSVTTTGVSGVTNASIGTPTTGDGGVTWTVPVSTGTGDGTIQLNLANATGLSKSISTSLPFAGQSYNIDKTVPAISIGAPSASATNAGPVSYTVTYSDANFNSSTLATGNITLNPTSTANASSIVVTGSGTTRTVTLSGITGNGTLGISIAAGTASDLLGNTAPAAGPSTTFNVDNITPTVSFILSDGSPNIKEHVLDYQAQFSEDVTGVDPSDFTLTHVSGSFTNDAVTVSQVDARTYNITVGNVNGNGEARIDMNGGTNVKDAAGNVVAATHGASYFADQVAPTVSSITIAGTSPTSATSVSYTVTFSESVTGVDPSDFTVTKTNSANGSVTGVTGSGTTYTVTVGSVSGEGDLRLDLNASGTNIFDIAANPVSGGFTTGQTYTVDHTPATLTSGSYFSNNGFSSQYAKVGDNITLSIGYNEVLQSLTMTIGGNAVSVTPSNGNRNWTGVYTMTSTDTEGNVPWTLSATDLAGNVRNYANTDFGTVLIFDKTPPAVTITPSVVAAPPGADATFTVTYTDANFNFSTLSSTDITVTPTGTAAYTSLAVTGSGTSYTVTLAGVSGLGTLGISVAAGTGQDIPGNIAVASNPSPTIIIAHNNADLSTLTTSSGSLTPAFDAAILAYTAAVSNGNTPIKVTPTAVGPGAIIKVRVNGGAYAAVNSGAASADLALNVGDNTIDVQVTAEDGIAIKTYTITVNRAAAPSIASVSVPADHIYKAGETLSFTVNTSENVTVTGTPQLPLTIGTSSVNAAFSGGSNSSALTFTYTVQAGDLDADGITLGSAVVLNGATIKNSGSVDLVLTLNSIGSTSNVKVDAVPPAAPTALAMAPGSDSGTLGDGITNSGTPVITGNAEANATVKLYNTDGTTLLGTTTADGSGNWSITSSALTEGPHTLTAKATDAAGNTGSASAGFSYILDTVGPTGTALSTTTVSVNQATNGSTVATLSATDLTAITYSFAVGNGTIDADNGKFSISGTSLVAAQNLTAGAYHIYLKATDAAGNDSFQLFIINVVDIPVVNSIVRAGGASATVPTATASVNYTVTFSQAVTGVDASDFTLAKTSTANGSIGSVTGSGTTYTVTVNSLSADGTIRLDLNSSGTGIQNGSAVAIASGYTGGETYTLDHTAPAAPATPVLASGSDSGTSNSDGITNVGTPVITGTAEANSTVKLYNTDGTTLLGTTTADGSGNWSMTSSTLLAGPHTLTAKATDAAGNVSTASGGLSVTIDTTAPTLAITSNVSALKVGETATITFTFSEDPGATFAWNGSTGDVTVSGGALSAISGSGLTRTATFSPTASTNGGTASISVAASSYTDAAGNNGGTGATPSLTFDTLIPNAPSTPDLAAASDAGTSGTDNLTNVTTPTFTGTAEAGATVTLYDTDGTTVLGTGVATAGNWSITSTALSPGAHTIKAQATDVAGNSSVVSAGLSVTIDTTAPTLIITSNASALKIGETAIITFTFTEDPGATFAWNGTTGDVTVTGGTLAAISGSGLTRTATYTPTANTNNGIAGITVAASSYTDAAGNNGGAGTTPAISFDTKAPDAPSAPAISGNPSTITINNPTFTGTAEAGATVTLYDTDGTTVLGTATATGGNWSITSSTLADVSHTIKAKATDAAGNVSGFSTGTTFTVNTAATITATGSLTSMSTTYGVASAAQVITVSGTNLTEGIKVTAPSGFEVSKDNSSYAANVTVGAAGTVSTTSIYVRLTATTPAGPYNGNVAVSSTGATTVNIATNATNTVNKATATITLSNLTATYDGTAKSAIATTNPASLSGVTITYGGSATPPTAANTYVVVASLNNANYTATDATGNLVISPKTLTVTATATNKGYDGTANATVTLGDDRINGDNFTTNYTAAFNNKNAATGKTVNITGISISGGASANYTLGNTTTTATADIAKKAINVTAQTDTKTYDGTSASSVAPVTDVLATGDVIATNPTQIFDTKNIGSGKTLTAAGLVITDGNSGNNYVVSYVTNTTGKITTKAINVTAQTDTKTYDGTNASSVIPVTDALATGDAIATAPTQTFDNRNAGTGKTLTAAGLVITDGNNGNNYAVTYVTNTTGKINAKTLAVTAQSDSKIYDATTASAIVPVIGTLISGDVIATAPKQTFDTRNVGINKIITPSGLVITDGNSGNNYSVNYITNTTGVITTATLTYTAGAASRNYGEVNPSFTGTVTGFVGTDIQGTATTGTPAFTTTATISSPVGSYAINGSGLSAVSGNYTFVQAAGNATALTIGKAAIEVTAVAKTKVYGSIDPQLTYNITTGALANGDTFTGGISRDAGEHVGTYAIKQGTLALSSNYALSYIQANLSITPAALAITADNQSKLYGQANPVLTTSYTGFVNGDDKTKLTTPPTIVTTATNSSATGTYPITASGAASGDYNISYTAGTLTVSNAALTVTANNQSKVYGQVNPTLTVSYSGFVNGDDQTKLSTPATAATAATQASAAGSYPIIASGATIPNYTISYTPGALTISKAPLTITAANQSRNYGVTNPALTVTYNGFVNGDTPASLTTAATATTTATTTTAPGTYAITPSGAISGNYSFSYVNGTLTIIPLTIADMNNLTISDGTLSPAFDKGLFTYKAEVTNATERINLTPTFDPTATTRINGRQTANGSPSFDIPLNVGDNTLIVEVTAQDGLTKKVYTLTVYRGQSPVTIDATNILTPNGDGKNDTWVIKDIQLYPNNTVNVYDRAGRPVYEKHRYNNEWDGTLSGVPLAQGTYYYTIDLGPGFPKIKGFITIMRSTN